MQQTGGRPVHGMQVNRGKMGFLVRDVVLQTCDQKKPDIEEYIQGAPA